MEGSTGAPPQRVCPKCARISWATGPQCPYCRARFTRPPGVRPWMLVLTAAIVLVLVGVMFLIAGNQLEGELDDRANEIQRSIDADLKQIQDDVRRELDAQGGTPTVVPTPTPFETPAPEETATPTPTPTQTPSFDDTGTPTPSPTIGP